MSGVSELLSLCLMLGLRLLERLDAGKASAFRAAVRADAGAEWVQHMGGTDARDADSRPADAGGHCD